jgi:hypothetical protein
MKASMRALGWALRFFWIISIGFGVTCAHSATLLRVSFGQPSLQASERCLVVQLPIILHNRGYYKLVDSRAAATIFDYQGSQLSGGASRLPEILPDEHTTFFHNFSFDLTAILARPEYLFNDSGFVIRGSLQSTLASLIPVRFETNVTAPWGAPLHGLDIGRLEISTYNLTHSTMVIPISFQNHSPCFDVTGRIRIRVFDDTLGQVGESIVSLNVVQGSFYDGQTQMLARTSLITQTGQIQAFIETEAFDYGPVVSHYG